MDEKIKMLQEELDNLTMNVSEEEFDAERAEEIILELNKVAPLEEIPYLEKEAFRKRLDERLGKSRT